MTDTATPARSLLTANLLCIASMLTWAVGLPAISHLVTLVPPLPLTAARVAIAGATLVLVWAAVEGLPSVRRAPWGRGIAVGVVVMGVGAVLVALALQLTDPVTVAIITALMPLVGIGLECLLDGRRLTGQLLAGLALSLAGGLVALDLAAATPALGLGALAALGSVLAFTWGSRATVTSFPELTPLGRTAITVAGAGIGLTAVAAAFSAAPGGGAIAWPAIGWPEVWALLLASIGSVAISQTLWIISVGRLGIGIASLHMNAVPFYVMLFAFALGGAWNWQQAAGAAIVVFGVLLAQGLVGPRRA
jgi:drug/metabolite transporter (DMT)-like permease